MVLNLRINLVIKGKAIQVIASHKILRDIEISKGSYKNSQSALAISFQKTSSHTSTSHKQEQLMLSTIIGANFQFPKLPGSSRSSLQMPSRLASPIILRNH